MIISDLTQCGYVVQQEIGTAFCLLGHVFEAIDERGKRCAVKTIRLDDTMDWAEIVQEVRACRSLSHPNCVPLNCAFVAGQHLCLSLPLSTLGSALSIMEKFYKNGLPEKAIAVIARELLKAMSYLHKQAIIHRSIRASHILLDGDGRVQLTGFRYMLKLDAPSHGRAPYSATTEFDWNLESSLLWLAPEVLAQEMCGYGVASDVYSLGITLCELANGFPPFSDMDRLEMLLEKHRGTTPRLLDRSTMPIGLTASTATSAQLFHASRLLADAFHDVTDLCLRTNPANRPSADQLSAHPFIRRRRRTLLELLPLARPRDGKTPENQKDQAGVAHIPQWDFD